MWKPGNLVTIDGIVYRVKREPELFTSCRYCAFSNGPYGPCSCSFPGLRYKKYPLPEDCYLEKVKPKS